MRPRLKSDTFYIPVENGVYFRNNERAFVMQGKTLATWMERLAPLLDGRYDLAYLSQNLSPEKQTMVVKLVNILAEQGFVKDVSTDQPHTLSADIQQTYAPAITFIDYHLDSGASRFQKFLDMPVLAIGSGDALVALAHALLETGNRHIHLLDVGEERTDYERIANLLAMLQADRDAGLTLSTITVSDWNDDENFKRILASFKMVVYFSTGASLSLVDRLASFCYQAGVLFVPAVLVGKQVIIGPTQHSEAPGCWQCFWRRWQSAQDVPVDDEPGALLPPASARPVQPGATAIGLTANLLAFECFKQGTDIHSGTLDGQAYVLGLERLESAMHRVYPHPLCTICAAPYVASSDQLEAEIAILQQRDTSQQARELVWHAEQWTDACAGIFTRIHEQDFSQLPLVQSQVTVAAPCASALTTASAAGLDYQEVRELAARKALSYYLGSLADPRRVYSVSPAQLRSQNALAPQHFFGWIEQDFSAQQPVAWLWAWQLDESCPVLVPAAAAYPRAGEGPRLFQPDIPGTGVGASWYEALARGLLEIGQAIDFPAQSARGRARLVARSACAGDSTCAAYLKMLDIPGYEVRLVDRTGTLGLPSIAAYHDGRCISRAAHWNTIAAVREVLKTAVLVAQTEHFSSPGDRSLPQGTADGLVAFNLAGASPAETLPVSLAEETNYCQASRALLERLGGQGWKILVVPAGGDTAIAAVMGCALRVLAARQEITTPGTGERSEV